MKKARILNSTILDKLRVCKVARIKGKLNRELIAACEHMFFREEEALGKPVTMNVVLPVEFVNKMHFENVRLDPVAFAEHYFPEMKAVPQFQKDILKRLWEL